MKARGRALAAIVPAIGVAFGMLVSSYYLVSLIVGTRGVL
jgi:hypothetical protein